MSRLGQLADDRVQLGVFLLGHRLGPGGGDGDPVREPVHREVESEAEEQADGEALGSVEDPRRALTSYGSRPISSTRAATRGMSCCSGCSCRPHARRSTPFASASRMPSVTAPVRPPTTSLALLRKADSALAKGSSQTTSGAASASAQLAPAVLVGELDGIRDAHEGARAAPSGVEVVTLHRRQGYGSAPASRTTGRRSEGSRPSRQSDIMSIIGVCRIATRGRVPHRLEHEKWKDATGLLPFPTYSAPGVLRQDPGHAAESLADT